MARFVNEFCWQSENACIACIYSSEISKNLIPFKNFYKAVNISCKHFGKFKFEVKGAYALLIPIESISKIYLYKYAV